MNITPVNTLKYSYSPSFGFLRYTNNSILKSLDRDTVELSSKYKNKTPEELYEELMSDKHKFSVVDYKSLSKEQINGLREFCSKQEDVDDAVKATLSVALNVKNYLLKKFWGRDFTIVSIGTSPAILCKTLEFMGEKVKYLPISSLRNITDDDINSLNNDDKRKVPYKNYLESQGITQEQIEKNNEDVIFLDYTYSGNSFKNFKKIMENCFGLDSNLIEYETLNELIINSSGYMRKYVNTVKNNDKNELFEYINVYDYIRDFLKFEKAEIYSGIPHLPFKNLDKISELQDYSSEKSNVFNFIMIDELNKMGKLKKN